MFFLDPVQLSKSLHLKFCILESLPFRTSYPGNIYAKMKCKIENDGQFLFYHSIDMSNINKVS
jgi:hypothetical protein